VLDVSVNRKATVDEMDHAMPIMAFMTGLPRNGWQQAIATVDLNG